MKKLVGIAALLLVQMSLNAQFAISGKVLDRSTQQLLEGASIVILKPDQGKATVSDRNGRYQLEGLSAGDYTFRISHVGYVTYEYSTKLERSILLNFNLEPETKNLESVIVSATRVREDEPFSTTNLGVDKIESIYSGQDPSVVLERLVPSILSYSDAGADIGNYVQFRMRGIDQTRINTTLNGVPLNDMIDQGVFFSNFSDFSNSMESIQVQRGVGTSSNGVASFAGAVNFESKRLGTSRPGAELQVLAGSFGTLRTSGELSTGKLDNKLALYSRFTRTQSDGYKNHSGSDSYSFFVSGGYLGDKDILRVTAFAGKTENDQSYLPVLLADINNDPKTNYNHPNDTDNFEQELVQIQYGRQLNSVLNWNSSVYYGGARGVFPFGLDNTTQLMFGLSSDHYGFLSDLNYEQGAINLSTGVHVYTFNRNNFNYTAPNVSNPDYEDETQKNEFSYFAKLNYETGRFNLYADFQLRSVKLEFNAAQILSFGGTVPAGGVNHSRDWFFFNPKIGVNYNLNEQSSLYASFGRTGREPTRTDILQGDGSSINEFNFFSAQDASIVSKEYVNNLELGYRLNTASFNLIANYFVMDFEDEISLVGGLSANSYVPLRQNIADTKRSGLEIQTEYRPSQQWAFNLNATYMSTEVEAFNNGTEIFNNVDHIFAPEWIISPAINWTASETLSFNLNGRYVAESFMELSNNPGFTLPSYFITNLRADINFSETISFSMMLNNLFDELYFTDGAPVDIDFDGTIDGPGFRVQPPRNFYAMLKLKF